MCTLSLAFVAWILIVLCPFGVFYFLTRDCFFFDAVMSLPEAEPAPELTENQLLARAQHAIDDFIEALDTHKEQQSKLSLAMEGLSEKEKEDHLSNFPIDLPEHSSSEHDTTDEEEEENDATDNDTDDDNEEEEDEEEAAEGDVETAEDRAFVVRKRVREIVAEEEAGSDEDGDDLDPEVVWNASDSEAEYVPPSRKHPRLAHAKTNLAIKVCSQLDMADIDMGLRAEVLCEESGVDAPAISLKAAGLSDEIMGEIARLAEMQKKLREEERQRFHEGATGSSLITQPSTLKRTKKTRKLVVESDEEEAAAAEKTMQAQEAESTEKTTKTLSEVNASIEASVQDLIAQIHPVQTVESPTEEEETKTKTDTLTVDTALANKGAMIELAEETEPSCQVPLQS